VQAVGKAAPSAQDEDAIPASKLGFVRFPSDPGPEDAVVCDMVEGLIERQDASSHVVDIFPSSPM
jgi:hypothetical protein